MTVQEEACTHKSAKTQHGLCTQPSSGHGEVTQVLLAWLVWWGITAGKTQRGLCIEQ